MAVKKAVAEEVSTLHTHNSEMNKVSLPAIKDSRVNKAGKEVKDNPKEDKATSSKVKEEGNKVELVAANGDSKVKEEDSKEVNSRITKGSSKADKAAVQIKDSRTSGTHSISESGCMT